MVVKRGQSVEEFSGLYLALGIITTILGALLMIFPFVGTLAIDLLLGISLFILGITGIVVGFLSHKQKGSTFIILNGILGIIVGCLLLFYPIQGIVALTFLMGIVLILQGIFEIGKSSQLKQKLWKKALLVDGIFCIIIGLLVFVGWPSDAIWVIGFLFGLSLLFVGILAICFSRAIKKVGL